MVAWTDGRFGGAVGGPPPPSLFLLRPFFFDAVFSPRTSVSSVCSTKKKASRQDFERFQLSPPFRWVAHVIERTKTKQDEYSVVALVRAAT